MLRPEATYHLAEFYFLLRTRSIEAAEDIGRLAELHHQYMPAL